MLRARHQLSTSYPAGRFAFWMVPSFPRKPLASPKDILDRIPSIRFPCPPPTIEFPTGTPTPVTGGIFFDALSSRRYRYAEVNEFGLIFGHYGFWWDEQDSNREFVYLSVAAHVLLAALEYGLAVQKELGYLGLLDFEFRLSGVRNRRLRNQTDCGTAFKSMDDLVSVISIEPAHTLDTQKTSRRLLKDILWSFAWDATDKDIEGIFKSIGVQR